MWESRLSGSVRGRRTTEVWKRSCGTVAKADGKQRKQTFSYSLWRLLPTRKIINNSKIFEALRKSEYFKKCNHLQLKTGRFPYLPRFTKLQNYLLESLYTIGDIKKPTAFRIYLYLLRQVTGYNNRIGIEYSPKKFMAHMNMGKCLYGGIKFLENKNMIYFYEKDGVKWIGLNPYPDTWVTDSNSAERIDEIINKEINAILGISDDTLISSSSSSWSSSSSSSESYPSDGEAFNNQLLEELDNM